MVRNMSGVFENKTILLVISGGIAAYKSLELIRLIRKRGGQLRVVLTAGGAQFVTPLSVSALCEHPVYTDLWSLKDEMEMGHIRLSREADVVLVAPASADILAKMAHGRADDLATAALLASDKPILVAPAMNHQMWDNPATQDNLQTLAVRGVTVIPPEEGEMACGEFGVGRLAEPEAIITALESFFFDRPLKGLTALVTSGPTYEPIDPVRFIGNRSSGKQGYAIAAALLRQGAQVRLISGPVAIKPPEGAHLIRTETAEEMLKACETALPVDIAICAAAVGDWRMAGDGAAQNKLKKVQSGGAVTLTLEENPDILQTLSNHKVRPKLVIGFSAETNDLLDNSNKKLEQKNCDWIIANNVAGGAVFGSESNHVHLFKRAGAENSAANANKVSASDWGVQSKKAVADRLVAEICAYFTDLNHSEISSSAINSIPSAAE
jgi:phosphopantothenoylcysteine decarboxylase/phosphopantothenate--cysteine ligase